MKSNWITLEDAFIKEDEKRLDTKVSELCVYGIKPLDDTLVCMDKNELVVIGGDSGVGKSAIAINIARANIKRGKKVVLYYLEGEHWEAISRMKWRDITQIYYKDYSQMGVKIDYREWMLNINVPDIIREIHQKLYIKYKEEYKNNLFLYASEQGLNLDSFLSSLMEFHKLIPIKGDIMNPFNTGGKIDIDLIIIDHLQYFSLTSADKEIFEVTEILRKVKNITRDFNIPVVLISHLRKKGKDRGFPGQEDFYGSSNIPKISSTAITIAPIGDKEDPVAGIYPTGIRVCKSRIGIRPNYIFAIDFYLNRREYADNYEVLRLDSFGHIIETEKDETNNTEKRFKD